MAGTGFRTLAMTAIAATAMATIAPGASNVVAAPDPAMAARSGAIIAAAGAEPDANGSNATRRTATHATGRTRAAGAIRATQPPPPGVPLSATGPSFVSRAVPLGLGMIGLGLVAMLAERRRRQSTPSRPRSPAGA